MREYFNHIGDKLCDFLFFKWLRSMSQISFKIGHAFLHLYVPFLDAWQTPFHLLYTIAASVLDDVRVRIVSNLGEQLYLFSEDELSLLVIKPDLFYTFQTGFIVYDLINYAVSCADYLSYLVSLP